jgi:hypothetical protein
VHRIALARVMIVHGRLLQGIPGRRDFCMIPLR